MHIMKLFLGLILVSSLSGCALFKTKAEPAIVTPEQVEVDPRALQPCKPLVQLDTTKEDLFIALLDNTAANTAVYLDCVKKQNNSIELLKKFSNKKETK